MGFCVSGRLKWQTHESYRSNVDLRSRIKLQICYRGLINPYRVAHGGAAGRQLTSSQREALAAVDSSAPRRDGLVPVRTGLAWATLSGEPPR